VISQRGGNTARAGTCKARCHLDAWHAPLDDLAVSQGETRVAVAVGHDDGWMHKLRRGNDGGDREMRDHTTTSAIQAHATDGDVDPSARAPEKPSAIRSSSSHAVTVLSWCGTSFKALGLRSIYETKKEKNGQARSRRLVVTDGGGRGGSR